MNIRCRIAQPADFSHAGEKHERRAFRPSSDAAHEAKDYRTMKFLDWFIEEQMEEEDTADDMITRMKLFGNDAKALYDLDQEAAARTYTVPAPLATAE